MFLSSRFLDLDMMGDKRLSLNLILLFQYISIFCLLHRENWVLLPPQEFIKYSLNHLLMISSCHADNWNASTQPSHSVPVYWHEPMLTPHRSTSILNKHRGSDMFWRDKQSHDRSHSQLHRWRAELTAGRGRPAGPAPVRWWAWQVSVDQCWENRKKKVSHLFFQSVLPYMAGFVGTLWSSSGMTWLHIITPIWSLFMSFLNLCILHYGSNLKCETFSGNANNRHCNHDPKHRTDNAFWGAQHSHWNIHSNVIHFN